MKYNITINRQFGSLGRPIAKHLAELLGIDFYDRDIVERSAVEMGAPLSLVSEEEEAAKKYLWMRFPFGHATTPQQDEIFEIEKNIIQQFADRKSCIIVGRCSDAILAAMPNVMHIYIYAPFEARLKNCVETLKMDEKTARKTIREVDKMRDQYHKTYAGYLPGNIEKKHILIDSSFLEPEQTAQLLADIARKRFRLNA